ncbi:MAG TPA: hypothetical protein PKN48_02335 [Bacteroidales bacterium]|nr:hypothetical protein [Bacteroidales bacterium]
MKKIFAFLLLALVIGNAFAQWSSDTLRRSAGFYISPAVTGLTDKNEVTKTTPAFGLNIGYRFINKLKFGFFLEGGAGISWLGGNYPSKDVTVNAWGREWTYSEDAKATQLYICAPFLAGYKTQKGKVRFQTSLGISFNIKYSDFKKVTVTGEDPYGIPGTKTTGDEVTFGTSFSGIFKAGISVPLKDRMSLDILPSLRYNFVSSMPEDFDVRECVTTDFQNWSAGIDIGLVWALDNKPPQTLEETAKRQEKEREADYTYQYNPDEPAKPAKEIKVKKGPYNFFYFEALGSGLTYSFNYERTLIRKNSFSLQARGGYGFIGNLYSFPLGVNVTFGHATQKFEGGIYSTFESVLLERFNVNIVPEIAYRLETKDHFFLRLALMSHYVTKTGEILPGIGVSVGGCF